ncbi:MAG: phage holin family protein [Inhella sp.]|jgi:uncharacterized membrane protein YqjE|uniref:phage holin family protein n=1 Tax=Inhella sp. TaxID=1921806 RepID=UPI0022BD8B47|nr:phage holin family protein [Inhella sp.]MCZ8234306.1 phage holin family protein [Inhella sp.]
MLSGETAPGLWAALRGVASAALALGSTRLELAATELEEERLRWAELALWATLTLCCLVVGTVFSGLLIVLLLWDGPRELALAGLSVAFLLAGWGACRTWRRKARDKPPLLAATRAELRDDCQALARLPARGR